MTPCNLQKEAIFMKEDLMLIKNASTDMMNEMIRNESEPLPISVSVQGSLNASHQPPIVDPVKLSVPCTLDASIQTLQENGQQFMLDDFYNALVNNPFPAYTFRCVTCAKHFTNQRYLTAHIRTHCDDKSSMHKCDKCAKCYKKRQSLESHVRGHDEKRTYECERCCKNFTTQSHLNAHNNRAHSISGERPHKCDICEKSFNDKNSLTMHYRTHTGERPYSCNLCGKCFTRRSDIGRHLRIHTGDKPFQCQVCDKRFSDKSSYTRHTRIHTGEKYRKCAWCSKKFNDSSSLARHARVHEGEQGRDYTVTDSSTNTEYPRHFIDCTPLKGSYEKYEMDGLNQ